MYKKKIHLLIGKTKSALLKLCNNESIDEYNPNEKPKILIAFDVIGEMISNKNL